MATTSSVHGRGGTVAPSYESELVELLRILIVAGVSTGIVVIGLGSRLAMFLLRLTSDDSVRGVVSDDAFIIGRFTLGGTYNLVVLGAAVGVIGAAAYIAVAPWLIGPTWFRRATVGVTAGVLVGAMLIHSDGVDFTVLGPLWFAVVLFIALPALSGVALTITVDTVAKPDSWTAARRWRWVLPLLLVLLVPPSLVVIVPVCVVVAALLPLRRRLLVPLQESTAATYAVRAAFTTIPLFGLLALSQDLTDLF